MKVIVGVDEEACVGELAEFIRSHQWPENTEISVLNALAPFMTDYPSAAFPLYPEELWAEMMANGKKLVKEVEERIGEVPGVTVKTDVLVGLPVQILLDSAKAWNADLIIVGCHGRRGFNKFFLGSVSQEIVAHAPCTVVVLRFDAARAQKDGATKVQAA